jgi:hypothetical protein
MFKFFIIIVNTVLLIWATINHVILELIKIRMLLFSVAYAVLKNIINNEKRFKFTLISYLFCVKLGFMLFAKLGSMFY